MLTDRELRRKRRRIVVTHFELSWNDCKPEKKKKKKKKPSPEI